jgi:hypothetical protein
MPSSDETGPLGQCVYAMSTGRRCQKDAKVVLVQTHVVTGHETAYGYCHDHYFIVTKPRDLRLHKTAESLKRLEKEESS